MTFLQGVLTASLAANFVTILNSSLPPFSVWGLFWWVLNVGIHWLLWMFLSSDGTEKTPESGDKIEVGESDSVERK